MKTVILCGGLGTRLTEETVVKPKPMVEIGEKPILWHIMKLYEHYGFQDFTLALGYKSHVIKEYFVNYHMISSDMVVSHPQDGISYSHESTEDWTVTMLDTGYNTMTGGRIRRLEPVIRPYGTFMLTYGDGVTNLNIKQLLEFHKRHGKLATVTAVRPVARFGQINIEESQVVNFKEKPQTDSGWINGGFFVLEPEIFEYLDNDQTIWEAEPLENLAKDGQLMAYKHDKFWYCMDTLRDKNTLTDMWLDDKALWKVW